MRRVRPRPRRASRLFQMCDCRAKNATRTKIETCRAGRISRASARQACAGRELGEYSVRRWVISRRERSDCSRPRVYLTAQQHRA